MRFVKEWHRMGTGIGRGVPKRLPDRWLRAGSIWRVAACMLILLPACRANRSEEGTPVAECQEYEALFARCMHIDAAIASQPAALARTEADRNHLKEVCSANMNRLKQACR